MSSDKILFLIISLCMVMSSGCSDAETAGVPSAGVPSDFLFTMDVESADPTHHVNIRIDARGEASYDRYDTGGSIRGDAENMVAFGPDQVVEVGEFSVDAEALSQLWQAIDENHFFELTEDYRMSMGFSYAYIMVQADGRKHQVFNIGMEVPELRALVEAVEEIVPEEIDIAYREGVK